MNLCILHHKEEKEVTKLFHINIQINKTKVDTLFNSSSQENIIEIDLINNFGLDIYDNPNHCPLEWGNKDVELRVTKHCNIKFSITTGYID